MNQNFLIGLERLVDELAAFIQYSQQVLCHAIVHADKLILAQIFVRRLAHFIQCGQYSFDAEPLEHLLLERSANRAEVQIRNNLCWLAIFLGQFQRNERLDLDQHLVDRFAFQRLGLVCAEFRVSLNWVQ